MVIKEVKAFYSRNSKFKRIKFKRIKLCLINIGCELKN